MRPPVGVALISIFTGLYGLMWILAATLASSQANVWAAFGPFVGLAVVAVAIGLWVLRPLAWVLTLALYVCGSIWTIAEVLAGASDRLTAVFTGVLVVGYLIARKDRFVRSDPVTTENAQ